MEAPRIYDRRTGEIVVEKVLGDGLMRLAYRPIMRPISEWLLFRNYLISRLLGAYADSRLSRGRIEGTIASLGLDVSEFRDPVDSFHCFNDFFIRHLRPEARPFDASPEVFCSPAECRLMLYPALDGGTCVPVKGVSFTVEALLGEKGRSEAARFDGGALVVFRLCPIDYHRYHFPADGCVAESWEIDGRLHSVNSMVLSLGIPVFDRNRRVVTLLDFERFGRVAFVEVGAFGVAGIVNTHEGEPFRKMDEKGYFKFGGSTLVLLFEPGRVQFDDDLIAHSGEGFETLVHVGETLGRVSSP
ncbi:MAG: phosphatidylserine decarboxylase [Lentisphaeria bacterium]|nr:phosphatidylserine decarboxylase [Lentisphaeria bacterium]